MPVGFHVRERLADTIECEDPVDRQSQFSGFHRWPDVPAHVVEDLADFLDRAGTEGDADIADTARGVQVEIEVGMGAAEPADIDDAALDLGGGKILACDLAGDLIDNQIDAIAAGCLQHLIDPARIAGIDREIGAKIL